MTFDLVEAYSKPRYPAAETARLVGLTPSRVRRWLHGYTYRWPPDAQDTVRQSPMVARAGDDPYATFGDLVELWLIKEFLKRRFSMQKARAAIREAAELWGPYPFAQRRIYALGNAIVIEEVKKAEKATLLELLTRGQRVLPNIVESCADEIEFRKGVRYASRLYPLGKKTPVVIDPAFGFGAPTVKNRSVKTTNVYDLYLAEGEKIAPVCRWFGISRAKAEAAVRFEREIAA